MKSTPITMAEFVRDYCKGKQYDSCADSPCAFSSPYGCQHPMHPRGPRGSELPPLPVRFMEGDISLEQHGENVLVTFGDGHQRLVIGERLRPRLAVSIILKAEEPPIGKGRLAHFLPRVLA